MAKYTAQPAATVLADSINEHGDRLTTMEVTLHRFVLAEFNTHRVFSRNSASSRAIPASLQLERVNHFPATPLEWPTAKSGMQGGEPLTFEQEYEARNAWRNAHIAATRYAKILLDIGLHKSVVNRLLEPFLWHTIIVTSTEWENFFKQRCSEQAQPEIRVPAELMLQAYEESEPVELQYDEWHLPLVDINEEDTKSIDNIELVVPNGFGTGLEKRRRVSVARCARVSYLNHDGERAIEDDLALYEKLATYGHWSPFEHVATPCPKEREVGAFRRTDNNNMTIAYTDHGHLGNFTGWDQFRHIVELT